MKNSSSPLLDTVEKMRHLAVRYRDWAGEYSGELGLEYGYLADDTERSISELELHIARQGAGS